MIPKHKTFEEQLKLFESQGMEVEQRDVKKLSAIGYYKIKQFATPISKKKMVNGKLEYDYSGISFSDVLKRYYQDKNLRANLLHGVEKVEVALKTKVAYILGQTHGAFGYLDFSKWCNKGKFSKFDIEKRQYFFKKDILQVVKRTNSEDIQNVNNIDSEGFPTVWLAIELLTFGQVIRLLEIMSNKNIDIIAKDFNCSRNELLSWLKCMNFLRNSCAHNANILDVQLSTKPLCRSEWKKSLYKKDNIITNKLAIACLISKHLIISINQNYKWRALSKNIYKIVDDRDGNAFLIGFSGKEEAIQTFDYKTKKMTTN